MFDPLYWQTACLLQRSGALDGKDADYNKIAEAVSTLMEQGVNIQTIDINKSEENFSLDVEEGVIHFGLAGVKGVRKNVIDLLLEYRPFESLSHFIEVVRPDITSLVALVKCGGFDKFSSKENNIQKLSEQRADIKNQINGQNYLMLNRKGHWPQDTEELKMAQRIFNFTRYLKKIQEEPGLYFLDDRACDFLDEIGFKHDGLAIPEKNWLYYYKEQLLPMQEYLKENQEEVLEKVNTQEIAEWREKYFPGDNIAHWEIETLGICFAEHPLTKTMKYYEEQLKKNSRSPQFANFYELPREPQIARTFVSKESGRTVPLYKLDMLCGIAIAKDKAHDSMTLLTIYGPVKVKLRKQQYAHYDAQISQRLSNGKRKVIEKSWLNRGVPLMVHGMRVDDMFMGKTYRDSPMKHTFYKITEIEPSGKVKVQTERKRGEKRDDEEE